MDDANIPDIAEDEPALGLQGGALPVKPDNAAPAYRVLARKYRPRSFAELIGQEAMVRTLRNAIASGRLAHAFILTGVRGVGKTTTARILARCLNYEHPDGPPGPCIAPSHDGVHCAAIAESRHVDVIEMDAASRTGIDDIREIIEGVRYRPASARYKIYIIDEVHMLSRAAFNGLLKTLEEPPEHVIFIFATTEIRKVPVTVLSRCQRFDLRRVSVSELTAHLARIAALENCMLSEGALGLIARAAEGSVRDALSLLDQAIAHGAGDVSEAQVRDMLGLADRGRVFDLLEQVLRGDLPAAMGELQAQYADGADPVAVLQDMLDIVHWLTRIKLAPQAAEDLGLPETERNRGRAMAQQLSVPVLTRAWQFLLKGLSETREAQHSLAAAEMVLVRLGYAADLPSPADLIERLRTQPVAPAGAAAPLNPVTPAASAPAAWPRGPGGPQAIIADALPQQTMPVSAIADPALPQLKSFADLVALAAKHRDIKLQTALMRDVHLVHFETGRIEFRPGPAAEPQLSAQLTERLGQWTGQRWMVSISNAPGAPTLDEENSSRAQQREAAALRDPLVQEALKIFPGAEIIAVREAGETE
ncbi:MAG TPA: DNA polymerase III subunit gamma/tau [Alphaproteobacteria bacterium]|nr:DNA polymerase III subunit gamma/tau [Alphaproteobacteria bacterium]